MDLTAQELGQGSDRPSQQSGHREGAKRQALVVGYSIIKRMDGEVCWVIVKQCVVYWHSGSTLH